jgi:hypothetical protein
MIWKIILVLGILGILLGLSVAGASTAMPFVTDGRVDWDEGPIIGIIVGSVDLVFAFFLALLGLVFVMKNRKN